MTISSGSPVASGAPASTAPPTVALSDDAIRQREKLKKATQQFEAVFIGVMLKESRKTLAGTSALSGSSQENKMYTEMSDEKMAEQMSQTGSFGLAKTLYASLERLIPADLKAMEGDKLDAQTR